MKVSEMIKNLQEFMDQYGDVECYYASDEEGNFYGPVLYKPSPIFVSKETGDTFAYDPEDFNEEELSDLLTVCVVN